jgi:hypothetical protein
MFSGPSGQLAGSSSSPSRVDASSTTSHAADEKPGHLSDEIVFKIIVICLAMIHVMQKDGRYLVNTAYTNDVIKVPLHLSLNCI